MYDNPAVLSPLTFLTRINDPAIELSLCLRIIHPRRTTTAIVRCPGVVCIGSLINCFFVTRTIVVDLRWNQLILWIGPGHCGTRPLPHTHVCMTVAQHTHGVMFSPFPSGDGVGAGIATISIARAHNAAKPLLRLRNPFGAAGCAKVPKQVMNVHSSIIINLVSPQRTRKSLYFVVFSVFIPS